MDYVQSVHYVKNVHVIMFKVFLSLVWKHSCTLLIVETACMKQIKRSARNYWMLEYTTMLEQK